MRVKTKSRLLHWPIHLILIWAFVIASVLSQWMYFLQQRTFWFPRLFASSFFWTLLLIFTTVILFLASRVKMENSIESAKIVRGVVIFALSTIPSILVSLINFGNYTYAVDGLKIVTSLLALISLTALLGRQVSLAIKMVFTMYFLLVFFGVTQLLIGLNYATPEGFFTLGAKNRWWDYSAVWGPMASTGKNTYGVSLLFCICVLVPLFFRKHLNPKFQFLVLASLPFAILCIYTSKSRVAGLLAALLIASEFTLWCKRRKNFFPILLGTFFICVAGLSFLISSNNQLNEDWLTSSESIVARFDSREAATSSELNNWVWGVGYDGIFNVTASTFGSSLGTANRELGVNVDNFYLRRLIETGFLGLMPFLYFLYCLVVPRRTSLKSPDHGENSVWNISSRYLGFGIAFSCTTGDYLSFSNIVGIAIVCIACICVGKNYVETQV